MPRKKKPLDASAVERAAIMYRSGASLSQISRRLQMNRDRLKEELIARGFPIRSATESRGLVLGHNSARHEVLYRSNDHRRANVKTRAWTSDRPDE